MNPSPDATCIRVRVEGYWAPEALENPAETTDSSSGRSVDARHDRPERDLGEGIFEGLRGGA